MPDSDLRVGDRAVQVTVACAVLRIEQMLEEYNADRGEESGLFWLLLGRLESDGRRLRALITDPTVLAEMKEMGQ
jgi:hypothetical protein